VTAPAPCGAEAAAGRIEGYQVAEDDAAAAVDGEEPLSADEKTFLEIQHMQAQTVARRVDEASPPNTAARPVPLDESETRRALGTAYASKYSSNSCGCGRSRIGSISLARL
jgi:hypothetical protein